MKIGRFWAIALAVALVLSAGGAAAVFLQRSAGSAEFHALGRGLDGVVLTDASGRQLRWGDLKGRPRAVFFGFTHCPVICPVTAWELDNALQRIGQAGDGVRIDFITVDPARDTPERLGAYLGGFGDRIQGYTGSQDDLERLMAGFEVVARRTDLPDGGYTIDHTATVFLLDEQGRVVDVLAFGAPPEVVEQRLRALTAR